jgi:hypothetical protein
MSTKGADGKTLVLVTEARSPVQMTAVQTGNTLERGRSPVPITPAQTQTTTPPASSPPAPVPLKKDG